MTYDPGSPGALCYLEAAREIATKGAPLMSTNVAATRGLGRGLGSLIPTGPPPGPRPALGAPRDGAERGHDRQQ